MRKCYWPFDFHGAPAIAKRLGAKNTVFDERPRETVDPVRSVGAESGGTKEWRG
jgi:hypothetical protein